MMYNPVTFHEAHKKFLTDAKTLTDDDLAQFAIIDPKLAERARAKREGYVEADPDIDADKRLLAQTMTHQGLSDFFND